MCPCVRQTQTLVHFSIHSKRLVSDKTFCAESKWFSGVKVGFQFVLRDHYYFPGGLDRKIISGLVFAEVHSFVELCTMRAALYRRYKVWCPFFFFNFAASCQNLMRHCITPLPLPTPSLLPHCLAEVELALSQDCSRGRWSLSRQAP